jgi:hypothetical protein
MCGFVRSNLLFAMMIPLFDDDYFLFMIASATFLGASA